MEKGTADGKGEKWGEYLKEGSGAGCRGMSGSLSASTITSFKVVLSKFSFSLSVTITSLSVMGSFICVINCNSGVAHSHNQKKTKKGLFQSTKRSNI